MAEEPVILNNEVILISASGLWYRYALFVYLVAGTGV
jgi:hypothetical protein